MDNVCIVIQKFPSLGVDGVTHNAEMTTISDTPIANSPS